jgi:hypothetical protein
MTDFAGWIQAMLAADECELRSDLCLCFGDDRPAPWRVAWVASRDL